jgi:galactokinase
MTGAGFGGCAIALVEKNKLEAFNKKLSVHYKNKIGYDASIFSAEIVDGVKEVNL